MATNKLKLTNEVSKGYASNPQSMQNQKRSKI